MTIPRRADRYTGTALASQTPSITLHIAVGMLLAVCNKAGAAPAAQSDLPSVDASGPVESMFQPAGDQETEERIDQLIAALRSPEYEKRTQAVQHLTDLGPRCFTQLREAYHQTDDLELALQIENIVRTAYLNREVYSQHGFLGVSLWPYPTPRTEYNVVNLPEGRAGVQLARVIDDTGASRAGLQLKDVVIAVDDQPVEGVGQELVERFSRGISQRKPGDQMRLTVLRPDGQHEIDVTLGTCPPELARRGSVRNIHDRLQEVSEEFEGWWNENFRQAGDSDQNDTEKD